MVDGDAIPVSDDSVLQRQAVQSAAKYGLPLTMRDAALFANCGQALVFVVTPTTAFGRGKGEAFSQTRWRFERPLA